VRRLIVLLVLATSGFFLSACLRLAKEAPARTHYALQASRSPVEPGKECPVLLVRPLTSASAHDGRGLVYRSGEHTWTRDFYHELFLSPAPLVTSLTTEWLRDSGLFSSVVAPGSYLPVDVAVEGEILELHGDYRERTPQAVATLSFLALRLPSGNGPPVLLFQKKMGGTEPLADDSPEELVRGLGAALGQALMELEKALQEALEGSPGA